MKEKEKINISFLNVLAVSCFFYAPFSFLINLICAVTLSGSMLHLWANVLIFIICFFSALIFVFWKEFIIKNTAVCLFSYAYTVISVLINSFVMMIMDGSLWNLYSLLLVFIFSVIVAVLYRYVTVKSYFLSTLMYYAICLTAFLFLTTVIADYGKGNTIILLLGTFTVAYAISAVVLFIIKRSIAKAKNDERHYKRQFD